MLLDTAPFTAGEKILFCSVAAPKVHWLLLRNKADGSPAKEAVAMCAFNSVDESLRADLMGLKYQPSASELIIHYIWNVRAISSSVSRFCAGDPGILVIGYARDTREEIESVARQVEAEMRAEGLGYYFLYCLMKTLKNMDAKKSRAGLLSNLPVMIRPCL